MVMISGKAVHLKSAGDNFYLDRLDPDMGTESGRLPT
jgi:hypothetical protein